MNSIKKALNGGALNIMFFFVVMLAGGALLFNSLKQKSQNQKLQIGYLMEKSGAVEIKSDRSQGWIPANHKDGIFDKTSIYTAANSQTTIKVREARMQIDEQTLIQIVDPDRQTEFNMGFGGLNLSSDTKQDIIINVSGERLKLSLDGSTVKINKNKKTGKLVVESISGPLVLSSNRRKPMKVNDGEAIDLNPDIPEEIPNTVAVAPEPAKSTEVKPVYTSAYISDEQFSRRPALQLSILAEASNLNLQFSEDNRQWQANEGSLFVPDKAGNYWLKARVKFKSGQEIDLPPEKWQPEISNFELKQPKLEKSLFLVDPTALDNEQLFTHLKFRPQQVRFNFPGKDLKEPFFESDVSEGLTAQDIPAGTVSLRILSAKEVPFAYENIDHPLVVKVKTPEAFVRHRKIHLKKIVAGQYYYEAYLADSLQILDVENGNVVKANCSAGCKINIRYRSRSNLVWKSDEVKVNIPMEEVIVRKLAVVETLREELPFYARPQRIKKPWIFELGVGGNYLNMATNSSLTNASTGGFSGPTTYVSVERQLDKYSLKTSFLDVSSQMNITSATQSVNQTTDWKSIWMGASTDGIWRIPRIEYGLSYQDLPLLYQSSVASASFQNANYYSATLGFESIFDIKSRWYVLWDQRLTMPLIANATGQVNSFKPGIGTEGTLSAYRCFDNEWGAGVSWFGQYSQANFQLAATGALAAESLSTTMFNSNFQVRLQYGLCSFERR